MALNKKPPFNVTLIHPQGYVHAAALTEAADYVCASLRACGYAAARTTNTIARNAVNIVFCAHILAGDQAAQIPADSIIFNSERLVGENDWPIQNPAYKELLSKHFVWDYSFNNLACIPHPNKAFVQFGYSEALHRHDIPRIPSRSLLFYGAITPWRRQVLDELNERGVSVRALFGVYGSARDREMMSAWAVLNLHKEERDGSLFEPIRCFYPLINHVPVFSEPVDDPTANSFVDSVIFLAPEDLAREISRLQREPEEFQRMSVDRIQSFRAKSGGQALRSAVEQYLQWAACSA